VIVVIGQPSLGLVPGRPSVSGIAGRIADRAASKGAVVQLVSRIGDDDAGDALLLALASAGVGHAAVLRDPARPTPTERPPEPSAGPADSADDPAEIVDPLEVARLLEEGEGPASADEVPGGGAVSVEPTMDAADIELGLRYLVDFRTLVVTEPVDDAAASVIADAAGYAGAHVVALVAPGATAPTSLAAATILEMPGDDADGSFSSLVAAYAVAVDGGRAPEDAFREAAASVGWEPAPA
jgi:hypothetical protein